jgi:hypothetical protein
MELKARGYTWVAVGLLAACLLQACCGLGAAGRAVGPLQGAGRRMLGTNGC